VPTATGANTLGEPWYRSRHDLPERKDLVQDTRYGLTPLALSMPQRVEGLEGNRGRSPPYIEGNPTTAFAARLIPQYESHIRATKETIQFVVTLTKEIAHSNRVTKKRTPIVSQHVYHQGTVLLFFFQVV